MLGDILRIKNLQVMNKQDHDRLSSIQRKNYKNTSGFRGVSWDNSRKKWYVSIRSYGKIIHLGRFADKKDAARKYNEAAIKYHGELAYLNKVV